MTRDEFIERFKKRSYLETQEDYNQHKAFVLKSPGETVRFLCYDTLVIEQHFCWSRMAAGEKLWVDVFTRSYDELN